MESASEHLFEVKLPRDPYPGLRPFESDEWPIFFGREKMTDEVIDLLIGSQFLVMHGDSGCGKSSLVRAGVLARLEQESARGGLTWRTCATQPGDAPLLGLAESLAAMDGRKGDDDRVVEIRRALNFGADAPAAIGKLLRRGESDHICVLVDQFEELFAFAKRHGPAEAELYVRFLVGMLEQPPAGLYLAITMRSEFLGACAQFPGLAEAVNRVQYLVPRMSRADMLRAICDPARLFGGKIALELAERLMLDAGGRQDELPLIQHGLAAMCRRKLAKLDNLRVSAAVEAGTETGDVEEVTRVGEHAGARGTEAADSERIWRLDLKDYTPTGGLGPLLSGHADDLLKEASDKLAVERMFRALTDINAEGHAVRRPQQLSKLASVAGVEDATLEGITRIFRKERASFLRPYGEDRIPPETLIDISHEALIRCWEKLSHPATGWLIREFQDGLIWRSLLVQADIFERDSSNILSPATARERSKWLESRNPPWAERYGGGWDRVTRLVRTSVDVAEEAERAERARAAERIGELEKNARKQRRLISTVVVVALVASTLAIGAGLAAWQAAKARDAVTRMQSSAHRFIGTVVGEELTDRIRRAGKFDIMKSLVDQAVSYKDSLPQSAGKPVDATRDDATRNEGLILLNLGDLAYYQGYLTKAKKHYEDARKVLDKSSMPAEWATAQASLGKVAMDQLRITDSLTLNKDALGTLLTWTRGKADQHLQRRIAQIHIARGDALLEQGHVEEALQHYKEAQATAAAFEKKDPNTWLELSVEAKVGEGDVYSWIGNTPAMNKLYEEAETRARENVSKDVFNQTAFDKWFLAVSRLPDKHERQFREVLQKASARVDSSRDNLILRRDLISALQKAAEATTNNASAREFLKNAEEELKKITEIDSTNARVSLESAYFDITRGDLERDRGLFSGARPLTNQKSRNSVRVAIGQQATSCSGRIEDPERIRRAEKGAGFYRAALGTLEDLATRDASNVNLFDTITEVHTSIGDAVYDQGHFKAAVASYERALHVLSSVRLTEFLSALRRKNAWYGLGRSLMEDKRFADALKAFREAGTAADIRIKLDVQNANAWNDKGLVLWNIGSLLGQEKKAADAENTYRRALAALRRAWDLKPDDKILLSDLAWSQQDFADDLLNRDQFERALPEYRKAQGLWRRLIGTQASATGEEVEKRRQHARYRDQLFWALMLEGYTCEKLGNERRYNCNSFEAYMQAAPSIQEAAALDSTNAEYHYQLANVKRLLGNHFRELAVKHDEAQQREVTNVNLSSALESYEQAARSLRTAIDLDRKSGGCSRRTYVDLLCRRLVDIASLYEGQASMYKAPKVADLRLAITAYGEALRAYREASEISPSPKMHLESVVNIAYEMAQLQNRIRDRDGERQSYKEAMTAILKLIKLDPNETLYQKYLQDLRDKLSRYE